MWVMLNVCDVIYSFKYIYKLMYKCVSCFLLVVLRCR